jgi:thioredoxin-related protein
MLKVLFISLYALASSTYKIQDSITAHKIDSAGLSILYVFEGSDWCANCRRLEKSILSDSDFLALLDSNQVLIERLDFPQRKKLAKETVEYNQDMSEKLGFKGDFPTLVIYSRKSQKYTTLHYTNQDTAEFSAILLGELKKLNE